MLLPKKRFLLTTLICLGSLGASGRAQYISPLEESNWAMGSTGQVLDAEVGFLTGERLKDALILKGSDVYLMANIAVCNLSYDTGWDGTSLALVDTEDTNHTQYGYLATSTGLSKLTFVADSMGSFNAPVDQGPAEAAWANSGTMMAADANGDGVKDALVGLNAAKDKLLVKLASGSTTALSMGSTVDSMAVGYYHERPSPMVIAIATGNLFQIFGLDGTHVRTVTGFDTGSNTGLVTAVWDSRHNRHHFAWRTYNLDGQEEWLFKASSNIDGDDPDEGPVSLGVISTNSMFAFDLDGDGDDELGFQTTLSSDVILLDNARTDASPDIVSFSATGAQIFDIGTGLPPSTPSNRPILGDIDDNRFGDLIVPAAEANGIVTMRRFDGAPIAGLPGIYLADEGQMWTPPLPTEVYGSSHFKHLFPTAMHHQYTHLEVLCYHQASPTDAFAPDPFDRLLIPLPSNGQNFMNVYFPLNFVSFSLNTSPEINNFVMRYVTIDDTDSAKPVTSAYRPFIVASTLSVDSLNAMRNYESGFSFLSHFCIDLSQSANETNTGGSGDRPKIVPPN